MTFKKGQRFFICADTNQLSNGTGGLLYDFTGFKKYYPDKIGILKEFDKANKVDTFGLESPVDPDEVWFFKRDEVVPL